MFYRVRANDSIRETFVFDEATPAGAVYEVFRQRDDVRVVVFEVVDDYGVVISTIETRKDAK